MTVVENCEQEREALIAVVEKIAIAYPDVTTGEVSWYGSGDEGNVEGSSFEGAEVDDVLSRELEVAMDEMVYALYPGWENNEGGSGRAEVDFAARKVTIEHNWYEEVSSADAPVVIAESVIRHRGPLLQATKLPEGIDVSGIAEDAMQAAFEVIANRLGESGYPVTGDISPDEAMTLDTAFRGYVLAMALNNDEIATLNEETDD